MTSKEFLLKKANLGTSTFTAAEGAAKAIPITFADSAKAIAMNVASMLTVMGISATVAKIVDILKERRLNVKKREYFEQMMEAHPQLLKLPPETVARYWESLFRFAPSMAEDPLAAGAFITQTATRVSGEEFGGPPPDTYNTLSTIQKNMIDSRTKTTKPIFDSDTIINKFYAPSAISPEHFAKLRNTMNESKKKKEPVGFTNG